MDSGRETWAGSRWQSNELIRGELRKEALEAYYDDRLDLAYEQAVAMGAGEAGSALELYRMIEAEHVTREHAEVTEIASGFRLEAARSLSDQGRNQLGALLLEEYRSVGAVLGYEPMGDVLTTLFLDELNVPWTPGRHGFMIDKVPYDKICLPAYLMENEAELREAARHEYAHVCALNITRGAVPTWLDEAIAMTLGGELDPEFVEDLKGGEVDWIGPADLDAEFCEDREDEEGRQAVYDAYQSSAVIGAYLVTHHGMESLGNVLRAFSNNSFWTEMKMRAINQRPADEALKECLGFGEKALFDRAFDWAVHGRVSSK